MLADEVGVDFIGVGEHHRADFAVSSPETVLAAIASRTKRIRLGSAVTVLSSDDPIRVFQRFSTLDAVSNGRAEVILGRGSFIESFPLFGLDLKKYEELFNEKLDLFAAVLAERPVTWSGALRPPLDNQSVYPKTESGRLTTWIGVGGTPQSVMRAAHYGLPMMLAVDRRRPEALRALRGSLPPRAQGDGQGRVAGRPAFARLRRRDRRAGEGRSVRGLQAHARQDRRRTRLVADVPRRLRARDRARLALCRLARDGGAKDHRQREGARGQPLRHEIQRRPTVAPEDDAQHRALWAQGHSARARDDG